MNDMEMEQQPKGRQMKVLSRATAASQITAEQLMREAWEQQDAEPRPPRQTITDQEELEEYQLRKRTEFENQIRQKKNSINIWLRYAKWEESQHEFERARSIYERSLAIDYQHLGIWLKYAEMEMRNKNINSARNIWDRAVSLLPRVNQFWYKYIIMEDMLGNYVGVRRLYERWIEWEPDQSAWSAYIKFELRNNEMDNVRSIFQRFVQCHRNSKSWIRWAKFEEKHGDIGKARQVYEGAIDDLKDEGIDEHLYIVFAKFEERCKEYDRARAIYKFALDRIPKHQARDLFKKYVRFEKQYGDREEIEDIIVGKRRFQYEEEIQHDSTNYDIWFDYIRLEESYGDQPKIREIYERAIANVPPTQEKSSWKRYIYLWINYGIYEELDAKDIDRARQVYNAILGLIPHKQFSFSKIWIMFANFEIRQKNLDRARKIYGHAIGMAPSVKIFDSYIELEMQLGNIERCRELYKKFLEWQPENCDTWIQFATLETELQEIERARAIYNIALQQTFLDKPEELMKAYKEFEQEIGEGEEQVENE